jgi:hypothetical protein
MSPQVLANGKRSRSSLTGSAHKLLGTARTYITRGKDTLRAGLEINAGYDETLMVQLRNILKWLAIR